MPSPIHRTPLSWLPRLLLLLLALGLCQAAKASHLLGGEMTYRYLDSNGPAAAPLRYEITVVVYNNCNGTAISPRATAGVAIYDQTTGVRLVLNSLNYATTGSAGGLTGVMVIPQTSATGCLSPSVPSGCTVTGPSQPYILQRFVAVVNLPFASSGYFAVFTDAARNVDVANLYDPGGQNLELYASLVSPTLPNTSPVFSDVAVAVICANDTTILLNNAVDADGDRLVYSFGQPYGAHAAAATLPTSFTPPPTLVGYATPGSYSVAAPFGTGAGKLAQLDPNSGVAQYATPTLGKYVVAIDVQEYRNINGIERLIGTTRRDLQLIVASCPNVKAPVLPAAAVLPRSYTLEAGSSLTLPLTVTQRDGHPLTMTANSELLDGPGGHRATFNGDAGTVAAGSVIGSVTTSGANGTVTGTLVFNSTCLEARTAPYAVALSIKDTGCAGKSVYEVFQITVTKPRGPTTIAGDAAVCGLNTPHSYTASGGTAPGISWRAVGGTIVGSATANPVQVSWSTAGTYQLVARGVSQYGCLTDSATYNVTAAAGTALTVTGNRSICQGSSTVLTVAGATSYVVTGGPAPLTGAGPFTLSPTATTNYTIAAAASAGGCAPSTQVTIAVEPSTTVQAGPAVTACSGSPAQLGAAPVAGYTYSWSPATGLSSASVANPTVTLTNTTGALLTQTYTLTVTSPAGCTSTGTVVVTVNVPVAGGSISADQTVCAGTAPAALASVSSGSNSFGYGWESSPDNATWTVIAGATGATYAPPPLAATTYFRRRATLGSCGTAVSNVVAISVQQPLAAAVALAAPPQQCAGLPFTFVPVPTNAGPSPTYAWYVNGTAVAATSTYTSSTLRDGDVVRVELTPTAGFCAVDSAAASVTIHLTPAPAPIVSIAARTALPVCAGTTVAFAVAATANLGATATYQWQVDGVAVAGATGPSFSSNQLRDGQLVTVMLSTTTPCGPASVTAAAVKVLVVTPVQVSAGPDKVIMEGEEVTLEATANGQYPLHWAPLASLTFVAGDSLHPRAAPLTTTTYVLRARTGDCADSSRVTVTVTPRLRIPTAISPNGDGQDDTWEIDHLGDYPGNKVLVFNRWGNKVFEASDYRAGAEWNGTIGGQPAPIGTYYYIITLGNGRKYSGPLTVVY